MATGIAFDVACKKKRRKRFYIENIVSALGPSDTPCLYSFDDATEIIFPENGVRGLPVHSNGDSNLNGLGGDLSRSSQYRIDTDRIGGLLDQTRALNRRLQRLLDTTQHLNRYCSLHPNRAVLLHGYEGTGKTLLLDCLAHVGFHKVIRLKRAFLTGGTVAKNQSFIQTLFKDAMANQPALVVMDDLEELVPIDDAVYSDIISTELENLHNTRVMVVGATRSPSNVKSSILAPGRFDKHVELPIPDLAARVEILNVLRGKPVYSADVISSTIAAQTHGFTGKDLALLYGVADDFAVDRFDQEQEEMALRRASSPPAYHELHSRASDGLHSYSTPSLEQRDFQDKPGVTLADFNAVLPEVKPTALREIFTEKPRIRWADIGGSDKIRESFDKIIGWPLQHKDLLGKFPSWQPPKGVLLYGPPGCSKTLTAQAVANTYNFNFIVIKGAELISMYVGESERAIREVFRKAKIAAPCVIFFDEIDAIGSDRDSAGTKGLNVLTTLLNEMDGFEALRDVFILAATNKPETLDPALMRPGRFDSHVYLGLPNEEARKEILQIATRGVPVAGDIVFDTLVAETDGYSGAEIVRICRVAMESAIERLVANRGEDVRVVAKDFQRALKQSNRRITADMLQAYEMMGFSDA